VRWGVLLCGEAMLCIYEKPEAEFIDRLEASKRGLHYISHVGVRIENQTAWEETIEREGVEILYGGAIQMPHGVSWYVSDPTGWEIEVALWDDGPCFENVRQTLDDVMATGEK